MNSSSVIPNSESMEDFWLNASNPKLSDIHPTPYFLVPIIATYLIFVFVVGPWYMRDRKPLQLQRSMRIYNISNIIINFLMCFLGLVFTRGTLDCWMCTQGTVSWSWYAIAGRGYLYLKIYDLLDTVFFVLRKKHNQVTPLHVIHHSIMPFTAYLGFKFSHDQSAGIVFILNTFVHTIMYYYYHLASMGPEVRKTLWWKKYITVVQLVQFYITLAHALHTFFVPGCIYPKWLAALQASEAVYFAISFTNFYVQSYKKAAKAHLASGGKPLKAE